MHRNPPSPVTGNGAVRFTPSAPSPSRRMHGALVAWSVRRPCQSQRTQNAALAHDRQRSHAIPSPLPGPPLTPQKPQPRSRRFYPRYALSASCFSLRPSPGLYSCVKPQGTKARIPDARAHGSNYFRRLFCFLGSRRAGSLLRAVDVVETTRSAGSVSTSFAHFLLVARNYLGFLVRETASAKCARCAIVPRPQLEVRAAAGAVWNLREAPTAHEPGPSATLPEPCPDPARPPRAPHHARRKNRIQYTHPPESTGHIPQRSTTRIPLPHRVTPLLHSAALRHSPCQIRYAKAYCICGSDRKR